jgi:hypothetical protein
LRPQGAALYQRSPRSIWQGTKRDLPSLSEAHAMVGEDEHPDARVISREDSMRLISFSVTIALALLSSAALAQQQSPPTIGDTVGHPPVIPAPPPISEPSSTTQPAPTASPPRASEPAPKGYTGAYSPGPASPYYTGPIPDESTSTGRAIVGPDGSTKIVRAVPCTIAARETDGFTTCIGLPAGWRRR